MTINLTLRTDVTRRDGSHPLMLVLSQNATRKRINLGLALLPDQWDGQRVVNHPNEQVLNTELARIRYAAEEALLSLPVTERDQMGNVYPAVAEAVTGKQPGHKPRHSLMQHMRAFADSHQNNRTRMSYYHTMSRMAAYDPNVERLTLDDVSVAWLMDFDKFMATTAKSANSRSIHMRNIRAVMNDAINRELTNNYPFRRFKIKSQPTVHRALTVEQLRAFIATECLSHEQRYKDMFLLMFYLCGLAPVDLFGLTDIANGRITTRRSKTSQPIDIKVEPEAMEIIERYKGKDKLLDIGWSDHDAFLKHMNRALKSLGGLSYEYRKTKDGKMRVVAVRKVTWPGLSAYWARHTWASIANSIGISVDVIGQAMGHAARRVTDIYIAPDPAKVDRANRMVIDWVLHGRR